MWIAFWLKSVPQLAKTEKHRSARERRYPGTGNTDLVIESSEQDEPRIYLRMGAVQSWSRQLGLEYKILRRFIGVHSVRSARPAAVLISCEPGTARRGMGCRDRLYVKTSHPTDLCFVLAPSSLR